VVRGPWSVPIFAIMTQYFKFGKLVATHGLNGDLVLQHNLGKKTVLKDLQALFIEDHPGNFLPYFIEKAVAKSNTEIFIKLQGYDTKESARKLTPKMVWIPETDFTKYAAKSAPIALLGFAMIEGENNLGEIIEVIEQPHQVLCTIMYKDKEALIPIHEESLVKVDSKNKKVYVQLPDGLLDIYV